MLNRLTISELLPKLAAREFSSRETVQACLDQIERVDSHLKAFLSVDAADALAQADAADRLRAQSCIGPEHPLLGVPIALKDVIPVRNQPLQCGSKILSGFVSPYD